MISYTDRTVESGFDASRFHLSTRHRNSRNSQMTSTWTPKVGKLIAQTPQKWPKMSLFYILLGFRPDKPRVCKILRVPRELVKRNHLKS